jgi:oligosaccharide repeat unit polymerase
MQSQNRFLKPFLLAGWSCIAMIAIWQIHARVGSPIAALTAAGLLLVSLGFSRYVLGLPFTTGPMLYLALLGLFHLGLVVPWALGLYNVNRVPWFASYGLSRSLALVTYSILAYQLGLLAALRARSPSDGLPIEGNPNIENSKMFVAGNFIFVFGVSMFVLGLIQLDPTGYYKLTYTDTFRLRAESDPRFFGTGMIFASIGLCMSVAGASQQRIRFTLLYTGLWVSMLFYLGFRGPALIACLIVYTLALKKGTEFPRWFPWLALAFLLVAVPVMGVARNEPLGNRSFDSAINFLDAPAEMGQSIRPLIETEALVGPRDYRFGKTYLSALKAIIPNLALRWEAPDAESVDDLPPSHWIIAVVEPWVYKNYGGMGFSAIAEPYMNFGSAGVVAYFFLLAFALVRLEQVAIRNSYALATWGLILGPLLWTVRNDFTTFFRPAAWGLLCLGIVRLSSGSFVLFSRAWRRGNEKSRLRTMSAAMLGSNGKFRREQQ